MSERLVGLFLDLARLDGRSGHEKPVADRLLAFARELGLEAEVDGSGPKAGSDTGNVVLRHAGGGDFALLAHMDTARSTKDTKVVVSADRIASDGKAQLGADDRAGIAAILHAAERGVREKRRLKPFTLAFTVQEEGTMGGGIGLRLGPSVRAGFIFDSSLDPGCFVVRSPGAAAWTAEVAGRASHAGIAPEKGISALLIASRAVAALRLGRLDEETTANVGMMRGGEATNVVPPSARVEGEARSMDPRKVEAQMEVLRAVFEKEAAAVGGAVKFEWRWDFEPYRLEPSSRPYQAAEAALRRAGLEPRPSVSHGGSDANHLNANGLPSVNFGIGARNPHGDDEYILLEHLRRASDVALALLEDAP